MTKTNDYLPTRGYNMAAYGTLVFGISYIFDMKTIAKFLKSHNVIFEVTILAAIWLSVVVTFFGNELMLR